ncbi:aminotransferase class III-fold pyridoxal phosphate-dependent enzyme [Ramlibacter sp.]|uniref:aminotransferase class III-fold pyridoxal phosphate-dependent enzyme n=1 Tax=Ramlibacter sp. TaxID=1917967 RepID=UPI002D4A7898|nr:aminotransferase class III-fold pyridoxal phosphate-dependent enzyme [Ramlibacter sp.]HYD74803.1 aminotransferase class III-fold pyridoxal phosphate-dependent enzyme [Ramlibacter sp.]
MNRYSKSEAMLDRAERVIPLGAQTFSKSRTQYPRGVSPYFADRALGSRVWDVDGNEYIDFINAQCSVTLGHCDPDVTRAVQAQLQRGTIFTLSSELEIEVAEKIVRLVPCAEKVRFGKNGSDATSGAIRLARAFTGRERVAVCGYHGWQDWYIGSTARHLGVPGAVRALTHTWTYNDPDSLQKLFAAHPGEFAAVILEPMNLVEPAPGFLQAVQALCRREGVLLVFDETITGFRYALGGAQEVFGVTPDLATFGKGLANGYPVSAVAGRADVMKLMEEVFFSFTFGGETLSLAAALATMGKLEREPVIPTLRARGERLLRDTQAAIDRHGLDDALSLSGHPSWSFLQFKDARGTTLWELKTLYMQEVFRRGVLAYGTYNMSYAHGEDDLDRLATVHDEVFDVLARGLRGGVRPLLECEVLQPLFKVR